MSAATEGTKLLAGWPIARWRDVPGLPTDVTWVVAGQETRDGECHTYGFRSEQDARNAHALWTLDACWERCEAQPVDAAPPSWYVPADELCRRLAALAAREVTP